MQPGWFTGNKYHIILHGVKNPEVYHLIMLFQLHN